MSGTVYSTMQKKCRRIRCFSFFVLAKIRRNFATNFRRVKRNFAVIFAKFRIHWSEISFCRNFVGAKIRNCEISTKRKFAVAKFRQRENLQLRNFHKAKFCWQWRRVVMKTFCSDCFKTISPSILFSLDLSRTRGLTTCNP